MKQLLFAALAIATASAFAETKAPEAANGKKEPTRLQKAGGFVFDTRRIDGKFVFVNAQTKIDANVMTGSVALIKRDYNWVVTSETLPSVSIASMADAMKKFSATAAVFLVDDASLPTISAFPEAKCALVNVAALSADKPSADILNKRISKELNRGIVFALGGGYTTFETGSMQPVATLADLDKLNSDFVAPDSSMAALRAGQAFGFKPIRRATYRKACKEGWAPAPTNEFQKAIWDEVHTLPSDPIKIKFDPKKDK